MDNIITDAAELWLRLLEEEFACEISNHLIQSPKVKYPSGTDAKLAMLRKAYLKGRADAMTQAAVDESADLDADISRIVYRNRGRRNG